MKIDWNFFALLLTIATGTISTASTLWKISRLMLAKAKAQDMRDQALYEGQKIQAAEIEDIMEYLNRDPASRGKFYRRNSLSKLKENAFRDFEDEHTGFS